MWWNGVFSVHLNVGNILMCIYANKYAKIKFVKIEILNILYHKP